MSSQAYSVSDKTVNSTLISKDSYQVLCQKSIQGFVKIRSRLKSFWRPSSNATTAMYKLTYASTLNKPLFIGSLIIGSNDV